MDYIKDPTAIYAKSFATIQNEVDFSTVPPTIAPLIERMIHASGMVDLIDDIAFSDDIAERAMAALENGASIITDCEMVRSGMIAVFLSTSNNIKCFLNDHRVEGLAWQEKTTRSAAQVELWKENLAGSIIVIGNAPTALFALLQALDKGADKPAAIFAMPVGFVGAEESKQELIANNRGIPFITVKGRRGGSAIASAAFNAVARLSKISSAA